MKWHWAIAYCGDPRTFIGQCIAKNGLLKRVPHEQMDVQTDKVPLEWMLDPHGHRLNVGEKNVIVEGAQKPSIEKPVAP